MSGTATIIAGPAYLAARTGALLVERDDRVQLRARGRDPVRMVQGLITNDLANAAPERAIYAAMLTPKGRMIADLRVIPEADGALLLDLDAGALEGALAHLRKMVPPLFARFESPEPALRVVGVYGPNAAHALRAVTGIDVGVDAEDRVTRGEFEGASLVVVSSRDAGVPGYDVFTPAEHAASLAAGVERAGAVRGDRAALDTLRVEAGRPRWGAELDAERIPLEAGLFERAISTSKGCYTGQEVIIRILHRGHVNWHLRGLLLGDASAQSGTELTTEVGGKPVARITSVTRSPALGQTIALGYVRREIDPGAMLRLPDGATARVVELPFRVEERA